MSEYLLNIAARSTGNNTNDMLPSKPVFNVNDTVISQDFTEENNIDNAAVKNQFAQQKVVPVQPVKPQKIQQAATVLNKPDAGFIQHNIETSYFSKHIERVEAEKESIPEKNKSTETVSFKIEEPSQKTGVEYVERQQNLNEPVLVNKAVSKITPEKKDRAAITDNQPGTEVLSRIRR